MIRIGRYIEAAVGSLIVGCLYLPNGNPAPGPKFDYKLHLFERLTGYSQSLLDSGAPTPISRGNRKFESISLQRRVLCEPDFLNRGAENIAERWPTLHAPVVKLGAQFVRLGGDDGEAADPLARRRAPSFPYPAMRISRRSFSAIA
jgi:hypothetical protein